MKTVIVADLGINHHGNMGLARKMIADVAECGVSIAKFQYYSVNSLFGDSTKPTYNKEIYDQVKPSELDQPKIEQLMRWCEIEGIEFGCSAFDADRFNILESLGIKSHKAASRVARFDRALTEQMLATGKTTYVSLGFGATGYDSVKYPNLRTLYCVASYPNEYSDLCMPKSFKDSDYCGISLHSFSPVPGMIAISRGAQVVEVHYTTDKGLAVVSGGFDHTSSLDKDELKQLVQFARQAEKITPYCE